MLRAALLSTIFLFVISAPTLSGEQERELAAVPDFEVTTTLRKSEPDLGRSLAALVAAAISDRYAVIDREKVSAVSITKEGPIFDSSRRASGLLGTLGAQRLFLGMVTSFGERKAVFLKYFDRGSTKFGKTVTGFCSSVEDFTELVPKLVAKLIGKPVARPKPEAEPEAEPAGKPAPRSSGDFFKDLMSPDAGIRFSAAVELGRSGDKSAVPPLIRVLAVDRDVFVRRAAARSLGELNAWHAVPVLIDAITDREYFVAVSAHEALKSITGQDFGLGQQTSRAEVEAIATRAREWWESHEDDRKE